MQAQTKQRMKYEGGRMNNRLKLRNACRSSFIPHPSSFRSLRPAFTLVEMMIVIVIIGILASLIVPAVMNAQRAAKVGAARVEITSLESAFGAFTAKYGVTPPSGLTLYESGLAAWQADPRSMATMRRIWPQYDFTTPNDINQDGVTTGVFTLDGAECLAFWLGGMTISSSPPAGGIQYKCVGFSANPANPFLPLTPTQNQNRIGPFFEFNNSRFKDQDKDGFLEYRDSLGDTTSDPIVYYSMYEGAGYVSLDQFTSSWCGVMSAYTTNAPTVPPATPVVPLYFKSQTFQIICPGFDGMLGKGGYYDPKNATTSLANNRPTAPPASPTDPNLNGKAELDNLTNFNGGQLKDGG